MKKHRVLSRIVKVRVQESARGAISQSVQGGCDKKELQLREVQRSDQAKRRKQATKEGRPLNAASGNAARSAEPSS